MGFLSIRLELEKVGRKILLGTECTHDSGVSFLDKAIEDGFFTVYDGSPLVVNGIRIPVVDTKILRKIKNSINKDVVGEARAAWWEFWKKKSKSEPPQIRPSGRYHDNFNRKKSYSGKVKRCINCGMEMKNEDLRCSKCGSSRFVWE